jgi:hypothetical protein
MHTAQVGVFPASRCLAVRWPSSMLAMITGIMRVYTTLEAAFNARMAANAAATTVASSGDSGAEEVKEVRCLLRIDMV